jgi:hypothetical protein
MADEIKQTDDIPSLHLDDGAPVPIVPAADAGAIMPEGITEAEESAALPEGQEVNVTDTNSTVDEGTSASVPGSPEDDSTVISDESNVAAEGEPGHAPQTEGILESGNDTGPVRTEIVIKKEKHKGGRPSDYSQGLADTICEMLADGKSLRSVCALDGMPTARTVFNWFRTYPEFLQQYTRAKQESADAMAEDILEISDGAIAVIKAGAEKKSGAIAQAVRLQVDTRRWLMSKMKPKKYGDTLDVTSGGEQIKGNTIVFQNFAKESIKTEDAIDVPVNEIEEPKENATEG